MSAATVSQLIDSRDGKSFNFPVAAATKLLAGVMWALNSSHELVNASDAAARRVVGVGREEVDNTDGSAGDLTADVELGCFKVANDSGTAVTNAYIGRVCWVLDNQTVSGDDGTNNVPAGIVAKVDTDGVWVFFGPNTLAIAPTTVTLTSTNGVAAAAIPGALTSTNGVAAAASADLAALAAEAEKIGDDTRAIHAAVLLAQAENEKIGDDVRAIHAALKARGIVI
jgi:hypothetical protein